MDVATLCILCYNQTCAMLCKVIGGVILTSREEVVKIRPELNGLIVEREKIFCAILTSNST